ncbi:8353_t:CDS:2, partial [Racocetra persica]
SSALSASSALSGSSASQASQTSLASFTLLVSLASSTSLAPSVISASALLSVLPLYLVRPTGVPEDCLPSWLPLFTISTDLEPFLISFCSAYTCYFCILLSFEAASTSPCYGVAHSTSSAPGIYPTNPWPLISIFKHFQVNPLRKLLLLQSSTIS